MEPVFSIPIVLPTRGKGMLAESLHKQLRTAIVDGRLAGGMALPASRRVAKALGIARNTVVNAYDLLIAEGYVIPHQGAKATVAEGVARRAAKRIFSELASRESLINPTWKMPLPRHGPETDLPARSFRLGVPEHQYFPHDVWRRLSARALRRWSGHGFGYSPTEGIAELRDAVAQHVAFSRAVACSGDDVIITSGAQQAFDLLARVLVTPDKTRVAVEQPGYPPLRDAFVAAGARIVAVEVDAEGLCVERLPDDVRVICVTPSHQAPTGVAMSLQRRTALLAFARSRNAVIIEDDYDGEFRFGGRPLDALQTIDQDGRVFYVGTFSKSLFPSLRKGFVVAPAWARKSLILARRCCDSHCDPVSQAVLAAFIREGHLARHVRRMTPVYAERRAAILDCLDGKLGTWLAAIPPQAGLHVAAHIRNPEHANWLISHAHRYAPGVQSLAEYSLDPKAPPALVFGYGTIDIIDIRKRLAQLARAMGR
jgi:GntR family transcriptional regulator / MocR family aminotransferase